MNSTGQTSGPRIKPATGTELSATRLRLPDGSRSVQSPWVWRGFLFMSLIALGLCITFVSGGETFYTAAWAIITAGWFGISMWLWRRHVLDDDEASRVAVREARGSGPQKRSSPARQRGENATHHRDPAADQGPADLRGLAGVRVSRTDRRIRTKESGVDAL